MVRIIGYLYLGSITKSRCDISNWLFRAGSINNKHNISSNFEIVRIDDNWDNQTPYIIKTNFRLTLNDFVVSVEDKIPQINHALTTILCQCFERDIIYPIFFENVVVYYDNSIHWNLPDFCINNENPTSYAEYSWDPLSSKTIINSKKFTDPKTGEVKKVIPAKPPKQYVEKSSIKRSVFILREHILKDKLNGE